MKETFQVKHAAYRLTIESPITELNHAIRSLFPPRPEKTEQDLHVSIIPKECTPQELAPFLHERLPMTTISLRSTANPQRKQSAETLLLEYQDDKVTAFIDRPRQKLVLWMASSDPKQASDRVDAFVLPSLEAATASFGAAYLHAAGFSFEGQGIVLVGPSRAGKSFFSIAAALRGAEFVSDDSLFTTNEQAPVLCGFPERIGLSELTRDWIERSFSTPVKVAPSVGGKFRVSPIDLGIHRKAAMRPQRIIFLRPDSHSDLRMSPYDENLALVQLMRESPHALRDTAVSRFRLFAQLVKRTRLFQLHYRPDQLERALEQILKSA